MTTSAAQPQTTAQLLADEIKDLSGDVIQEIATLLDATPDKDLFGDTEFVIRAKVLKIVAQAYTARLAQKKTATVAEPSSAPTASDRLPSKATARGNR